MRGKKVFLLLRPELRKCPQIYPPTAAQPVLIDFTVKFLPSLRSGMRRVNQAQDKLKYISQLADKASKATEDEKQARADLSNFENENEQHNGSLTDKVAELKEIYTTLVELELELKGLESRL